MSTVKIQDLKKDHVSLQREFQNLKDDYHVLFEKYTKLLKDTSENTVIQSMNDMKLQYQEIIRNTVSKEKYEDLLTEYHQIHSCIHGLKSLIQNLGKHVQTNQTLIYNRIRIIKEIIDDAINNHETQVYDIHRYQY